MSFRYTWSLLVWDDRVIVGNYKSMIKRFKKDLRIQFSINYLVPTKKILGMMIIHDIRNKKIVILLRCHTP